MNHIQSRTETITALFPNLPKYRLTQINKGLFNSAYTGWEDITTIPLAMRQTLAKQVPWVSYNVVTLLASNKHDTYKAVLETEDTRRYETVLMQNKRGQWTICVSSQIGCAMACTFCATGTMGLQRSLTADEIADQYRFWKLFLQERTELTQRISNVVFMGMGEPLTNYENVRGALTTWLAHTDLGPTRITVSTVGVLPQLERLLVDPKWPPVRIAISLHSANEERRKKIVPTTVPHFLEKLSHWSRAYTALKGSRRHHVTFEYTLLNEVNDTDDNAHELAAYLKTTGSHKLNVIPYNPVPGKPFLRSQQERIGRFKAVARNHGITVTQRKTMGEDIAAACGQLVYEQKK